MPKSLHPKAILSSTLTRISAVVVVVEYLIQIAFYDKEPFGWGRFLSVVLLLAIAYIIRSGRLWIRWVLLALMIIGVSAMIFALFSSASNKPTTLDWCVIVVQNALQITATLLLFFPYHVPKADIFENEMTDEIPGRAQQETD